MKEGYSTATAAVREMGFGAGMGLANMKKYSDSPHHHLRGGRRDVREDDGDQIYKLIKP